MARGQRGKPSGIDAHVGARLRACRTLLGMSQGMLGSRVGLTFQQVQKYEHGANRISASTLYRLGSVLGVPVSYFFEGIEEVPTKDRAAADSQVPRRETIELVRAYYAIPGASRHALLEMVKSVARSLEL